ncbi:putative HTH-type transcriptional regulator [Mycobacterium talmoniae]|uniref:Putative HTH-type transcriptional regulator n=1 Tax=Mycobacterium talmoniae TaxID=1858794 RepID=A0A2S8BMY0_9MYCO|nr:putative HTH-type transcriptional regulator [Mycobacterium talmoniae]
MRAGDPRRLAAMCLLITQSTIQSAQIVAPILDDDALAAELRYALNGYLS